MTPGIYYYPEADQLVIAWDIYQRNELPKDQTNISSDSYAMGIRLEYYTPCGIAVEGPNGAVLVDSKYFKDSFVLIEEFT